MSASMAGVPCRWRRCGTPVTGYGECADHPLTVVFDLGEVVFFDDRADNVAAARAHGCKAQVRVDADAALRVLAVR